MPKENLVGQTIDGYTIVELVGEGGTSVVYRATHPEHGTVAFKVLRDKLRQDKTALDRFTREAHFGKKVTHPNVIRTFGTGQVDGIPYLVIEWSPGELLENYAKRNAPMPREEVATARRHRSCAAARNGIRAARRGRQQDRPGCAVDD